MIVLALAAVAAALGIRSSGSTALVAAIGPRVARVAHVAALLFSALFAGLLLTVFVLEHALRGVDAAVYTQVRHVELAGLDVLASGTLLPALVATALLVVVVRTNRRAFRPALAALVLLGAAFTVSVLVNLPINAEQLTWVVQSPPVDWAAARDRWQLSHAARTVATVLALGCLCAAAPAGRANGPLVQ